MVLNKSTIGKISIKLNSKRYSLNDMKNWFIQTRGFPSILVFGTGPNKIMGEGQSGGRYVSDVVHAVEDKFVLKLGIDKYRENLDILLGKV